MSLIPPIGGSQSNQALSAANGSFAFQTASFSNANGVSFSTAAGSAIIASHNGLTSQSNQAAEGSNGSFTFQTLSFSNGNGVSFGTSAGSAITASYTRPVVSNAIQAVGSASGSGTNTSRFAADDHVHPGVFSMGVSTAGNTAGNVRVDVGRFVLQGGNNVTLSQITAANALNTIVFSGANVGGAQTGISGLIASDATYTSGSVYFSNQANVTIGSSVDGASQYVRLSVHAQQTGLSGLQVSDNTFTSGTVLFRNMNGISFGSSGANGVSASYTVPTVPAQLSVGNSNLGNTAGDTGVFTGRVVFVGSNNITLSGSSNAGSATVSVLGGAFSAGVSGGNTAGDTGATGTRVVLAGGNNITVSQATNANGASITISGPNTAAQSNQTLGVYVVGNTTGQSSSSTHDARTLSIDGAGIVSAGWSNGTIRISATQSNQAFSAAGGASAFQTLGFSDNVFGSFTNTNGSVALAGIKASLYAVSNTTQATSGTQNLSVLSFNGAGGVSVGVSNGSIVISGGAAGGGNFSAGASTDGNTAGDTGLVGSRLVLVGSNGILLSQETNGGSATITIDAQRSFLSSYQNLYGPTVNVSLTGHTTSMSHAAAFLVPFSLSASFLRVPALMTTNSTTIATMASATATASGGLFSTINAVVYQLGTGASSQSLQSVVSGSGGYSFTQRISITNSTQASYSLGITFQAQGDSTTLTTQYSISATNYSFTTNQIATLFSGARWLDVPFANSLNPGPYWLLWGNSSSSGSGGAAGLAALTNCNVRLSNIYAVSQLGAIGVMGSANFTSGGPLGAGSFSTAGGGTTEALPLSAISTNASNALMWFHMLRSE